MGILIPHCRQWIDRPNKKSKGTVALNNTLDQIDLIDIYRAFQLKEAKYAFFSKAHGSFSKRPHGRMQNKPQQIQES